MKSDIRESHVPGESFEAQYRARRDPWNFAGSPYEQHRYTVAMAMLPQPRYRRGFEPGCSIGEFTVRLAARCDSLIAIDCSPTAVSRARERCQGLEHVTITVGELPRTWPTGPFDLVVLSELGYYFSRDLLAALVARSGSLLEPGGTLLAVHWRGHSPDHILHGDEVHELARREAAKRHLLRQASYLEDKFRADVWTREAA